MGKVHYRPQVAGLLEKQILRAAARLPMVSCRISNSCTTATGPLTSRNRPVDEQTMAVGRRSPETDRIWRSVGSGPSGHKRPNATGHLNGMHVSFDQFRTSSWTPATAPPDGGARTELFMVGVPSHFLWWVSRVISHGREMGYHLQRKALECCKL